MWVESKTLVQIVNRKFVCDFFNAAISSKELQAALTQEPAFDYLIYFFLPEGIIAASTGSVHMSQELPCGKEHIKRRDKIFFA